MPRRRKHPPRYELVWRWIDKEDQTNGRKPELREIDSDYATDNDAYYGRRIQDAIEAGYRVFYVNDAVLLKINDHWVCNLETTEHAKWLILDNEADGFEWGGDSIIARADVELADFTIRMDTDYACT